VLEFVLQDVADGRAQRAVAVLAPHVEILAHAVDLDRLEHEMDDRRAEDAAREVDQRELQSSPRIETIDVELEEAFPECEVARLARNELVEDGAELALRVPAQRLVERQVEQLVEHQPPRQRCVHRANGAHGIRSCTQTDPT